MLKKRIIASLFIQKNIVVQSQGFKKYLPVGRPEIAAEAFNAWGVDELFLIDINASREGRLINLELVKKVSSKCLVPLTVGGGIKNVQQIGALLKAGADKICLNQSLIGNLDCLIQGQEKFGKQCIVASIDSLKVNGNYKVFNYMSAKVTNQSVLETVTYYEKNGAGEIFLNDVGRDGSYQGYDIELVDRVSKKVSIPVVCSGGAGNPSHIIEVLKKTNVSGASAANYFHFTEHSITIAKAHVGKVLPVRQDIKFSYNHMPINLDGRVCRLSDDKLKNLLYKKIKIEKI
jgi:cyclase